ncbi:MAG: (2Fe-2S)-binding protein [Planctomycetota bacterium]|nr:(2Fe-2S)-binding protein [Planctomycetota bacterium]
MNIDRCVCYDQSFESLKAIAKREQLDTVEALQSHCEFGKKCRLCHPYLKCMLKTGQTQFHSIIQV